MDATKGALISQSFNNATAYNPDDEDEKKKKVEEAKAQADKDEKEAAKNSRGAASDMGMGGELIQGMQNATQGAFDTIDEIMSGKKKKK